MVRWEVRTRAKTVQVDGANWLLALGTSLKKLNLDPDVLSRLVCDVQPDGVVRILDPVSRTPMLVRRLPDEITTGNTRRVAPVGVVAGGESLAEDDSAELRSVDFEDHADDIDATLPPPPLLRMPAPSDSPAAMVPQVPDTDPATFSPADISTLQDPEHDEELLIDLTSSDLSPIEATPPEPAPLDAAPSDLAEQLFIQGTDIADATTIETAARITLDVLDSFVTAQAKSVLYAGINDTRLRFLAADGPSAAQVTNMTVPFGHGIAGFCFDTGAALIIRNARHDPRHLADVDQATGFHTGDMMSVALRDHEGGIHGCVQLINPSARFAHWQLEAVIALAMTLGETIRMRA